MTTKKDNTQECEENLEYKKDIEMEVLEGLENEELCIKDIDKNIETVDEEYDYGEDEEEYDEFYHDDKYDEINKMKNKKKKTDGPLKFAAVALVSSVIGAGITVFVMKDAVGSTVSNPIILSDTNTKGTEGMNIYQAVSQKASPSVVGIMTTSISTSNIFSIPVENSGIGTGVIVDSRGYILTNAHVVSTQGKGDIKVVLNDGKNVAGNVLWEDTSLDLAVVKIEGSGYVAAELGDSDNVTVGDIAIAIGNPLGIEFQATVTQGIISGLNRSVEGANFSMEGLLQTDASINPGNSGGPLLNEKGQVIGINTAKTDNTEGIGFAIPINIAKPIVEQVIKTGTYDKVTLGIKGMSLSTFETLIGTDLAAEKGVYIIETQNGTPAKSAGIKTGDVITSINRKEVSDMNGLTKELYKFKEGDTCEIVVDRSGEEIKLKVKFKKVTTTIDKKQE